MMTLSLKTNVSSNNDVAIEVPTHLTVPINETKYQWILKMMRFVKKNKIRSVVDYDATPDYLIIEDDENETSEREFNFGTECVMIHVCRDYVYWRGIIKHTDVHFESNSISLEHIKSLIKFSEKPIEEMPLYLNDEDYELKYIAMERMKGSPNHEKENT